MNHYNEEPLMFGPETRLLGVMTRPAANAPAASIGCLMFNFGITHRVGPRRIQVKLARRLATQGVCTLRFDLSGLGDSRAGSGGQGFDEQAIADLRSAVDEMQARTGIRQVVIFGLCSGAGHGLQFALEDSRVAGLLAFDGFAYVSRMARLKIRARRFLKYPVAQIQRWINVIFGLDRPSGGLLNGERSKVVTADDFRRCMDLLVARGVSVYLIYSGTVQDKDRNRDQLHALQGSAFLDKVRYEFMPVIDHSLTEVGGQAALMDATSRWMAEIEAGKLAQASSANAGSAGADGKAQVGTLAAAF